MSSDTVVSYASCVDSACRPSSAGCRRPRSQRTRDYPPNEEAARGLEADVHLPSRAHRCSIPIYRRPTGARRVSCALGLQSYYTGGPEQRGS